MNESRLRALKTPLVEYAATDSPGSGEDGDGVSTARATEILDMNTQWVSHLQLKVGAKVMLVTASPHFTAVPPPAYPPPLRDLFFSLHPRGLRLY